MSKWIEKIVTKHMHNALGNSEVKVKSNLGSMYHQHKSENLDKLMVKELFLGHIGVNILLNPKEEVISA